MEEAAYVFDCSLLFRMNRWESSTLIRVLTGSPSRGGDVVVYAFDINQPSLPTPFYSALVSVSVFMALSTVFHSINSPDNSPLSRPIGMVGMLRFMPLT